MQSNRDRQRAYRERRRRSGMCARSGCPVVVGEGGRRLCEVHREEERLRHRNLVEEIHRQNAEIEDRDVEIDRLRQELGMLERRSRNVRLEDEAGDERVQCALDGCEVFFSPSGPQIARLRRGFQIFCTTGHGQRARQRRYRARKEG